MGNEKAKPKKPFTKIDLDITAEKVIQHLTMARDRKINELASKERELKDRLKKKMLPYEDICFELITIVNLFKYVKAAKIVVRYSQLVQEHSTQIIEACQRDQLRALSDLIPYFAGVVWAADRLNLSYVKEFSGFFYEHFGPEVYAGLKESKFIDEELRQCFGSIEPTAKELNDYLKAFADRYKLDVPLPSEPKSAFGGNDYPKASQFVPAPPGQGSPTFRPSVPNTDAFEKARNPQIALHPVEIGEFDDAFKQARDRAPREQPAAPTLFNRRELTPKKSLPSGPGAPRSEQNVKERLFAGAERQFAQEIGQNSRPTPENATIMGNEEACAPLRIETIPFEMRMRALRDARI